jgi:pseudouridine-5'-phosphate glycosidase
VFATGGIGGAHRPAADGMGAWDISSDLTELGRTPVLVVCAGAKSLLDLPRTLEILETLGVPVLGYRTDRFPQFYVADDPAADPLPVSARVETAAQAAAVFDAHVRLGGGGAVLALACRSEVAVSPKEFDAALAWALADAHRAKAHGAQATPFVLRRLAELTGGRTLAANRAVIVANAALAAEVAVALTARRPAS